MVWCVVACWVVGGVDGVGGVGGVCGGMMTWVVAWVWRGGVVAWWRGGVVV